MLAFAFFVFAAPAPREAVAAGTHDATLDLLLPAPHEVKAGEGHVLLGPSIRLSVPEQWRGTIGRYLWLLDEVLVARNAGTVTVVKDAPGAVIRVVHKAEGNFPENGYELKIGSGAIDLAARDSGGLFNGLATLAQLIELCPSETLAVPCARIRDWPELATRAAHIDMTCQQYKAAYVQRLMRTLARYKINALLMEYSDMFPFREHKAICRADALSEEEIRAIRRTAEECHQELIPFLQCAGHLEYVLTREPYAGLSKGHGGYSYCLANDAVLPFAESLIDEILAQHPCLKRLHVGGDEVGHQNCTRCVGAGDFHAMYLRHYARIAEHCRKRGVVPLMWTDIMAPFRVQHKPEVVAAMVRQAAQVLPREVVGVDWRYGGKDFHVAPRLREAGFQAFTAPAARCAGDVFDLPRVLLHMENIQGAFLRAVEWKLAGTIITSWSYRGSPHEVCLPEYAAAAYGWNTREADVGRLLARFFAQRYGLPRTDGEALAKTALAETKENVPTALALPILNAMKRAWTIPSTAQAKQLTDRIASMGPARLEASLQNQLQQFVRHDTLWQSALKSAKRHQDELHSWDLSRRHLEHRLDLSIALARLKSGAKVDEQLRALAEAAGKLRDEWKARYQDVVTPLFMEIELEIRFDTEPGIIEAVRR
jgi:hypothetical protein